MTTSIQQPIHHPDAKYMRRALELARFGEGNVSPNPMVGAVIVAPDGKIIGEGWHRKFGGPHAEVNAVNSVHPDDQPLLHESTIYVTLEPCSHYGKTPPCSKLLIEKQFKRAVIGMTDPFKEVSGRGIRMLREAGIEVIENFLEKECREINRRFVTAHTLKRPYILLKWAQSSDMFIAPENSRIALSNPASLVLMHKERALYDAIMVGTNTILIDNPSLTNRLWSGNSPKPAIIDSERLDTTRLNLKPEIILSRERSLDENMHLLYSDFKITSLMVEGGSTLLQRFIDADLFDELRIETSPIEIKTGVAAPALPTGVRLYHKQIIRNNLINRYLKENLI